MGYQERPLPRGRREISLNLVFDPTDNPQVSVTVRRRPPGEPQRPRVTIHSLVESPDLPLYRNLRRRVAFSAAKLFEHNLPLAQDEYETPLAVTDALALFETDFVALCDKKTQKDAFAMLRAATEEVFETSPLRRRPEFELNQCARILFYHANDALENRPRTGPTGSD